MARPLEKLTLQAFLEWESAQPTRNEFYRGEVFALVGARRSHGRVISNLSRHLGNALEGSPCQVFHEGMRLQVADEAILYPDLFVTCDRADLETESIFRSPKLIIEVLSPTTEEYDRSTKFALYRRIATLEEYVLINPDTRRIEAFARGAGGVFTFHDWSDGASLRIVCLGIEIPIGAVFTGI